VLFSDSQARGKEAEVCLCWFGRARDGGRSRGRRGRRGGRKAGDATEGPGDSGEWEEVEGEREGGREGGRERRRMCKYTSFD